MSKKPKTGALCACGGHVAQGYAGGGVVKKLAEFLPQFSRSRGALSALSEAERASLQAALAAKEVAGPAAMPKFALPEAQRGAMRMRGGNFDDASLERYMRLELGGATNRANSPTGRWAKTQLRNYLRKDLGAPTDPLLKLEAEGTSPLPEEMRRNAEYEVEELEKLAAWGQQGRGGKHKKALEQLEKHDQLSSGTGVGRVYEGTDVLARPSVPLTPWGYAADSAVTQRQVGDDLAEELLQAQRLLPRDPYRPYFAAIDEAVAALRRHRVNQPDAETGELVGEKIKKLEGMRWMEKNPTAPIYGLSLGQSATDLGFAHVLDYLDAAVDPYSLVREYDEDGAQILKSLRSNMPMDEVMSNNLTPVTRRTLEGYRRLLNAGLDIDPTALTRTSVADAVKKTSLWDEMLAATQEASPDLQRGIKNVHKEYPEAEMRWVELGLPEKTYTPENLPEGYSFTKQRSPEGALRPNVDIWSVAKEGPANTVVDWHPHWQESPEKALETFNTWARKNLEGEELRAGLNAEGEAMGHCVGGYCDEVAERGTRIYSLRDAKGQPHVTVEVRAPREHPNEAFDRFAATATPEEKRALGEKYAAYKAAQDAAGHGAMGMPQFAHSKGLLSPAPQEIVQIKGKQNAAPVEKYLPFVQDFVRSGQWGQIGDLRNTGLHDISRLSRDKAEQGMWFRGTGRDDVTLGEVNAWRDANSDARFISNAEVEQIIAARRRGYASGGSVQPQGSRARGQANAPGFSDAIAALGRMLLDTGAGAARGFTAATLGLPGEMERLQRAGLNAYNPTGDGVIANMLAALQAPTTLPDTERMLAKLPAGPSSTYGKLGQTVGEYGLVPIKPGAVGSTARKLGAEGAVLARGALSGPTASSVTPRRPIRLPESQRGAVRLRGGNFDEVGLDSYLFGSEAGDRGLFSETSEEVNEWGGKQLRNYLRKDLGSPTDPLLALEKEGALHLSQDQLERGLTQPILDHLANRAQRLPGTEPTPWANLADSAVLPRSPQGYIDDLVGWVPEGAGSKMDYVRELHGSKFDWLENATPDTKIWQLGGVVEDLGFDHVRDFLEASRKAHSFAGPHDVGRANRGLETPTAEVQRAIALADAGLALSPEQLARTSVADAVRKTSLWNEVLAKIGTPANPDLQRGIKNVHKEYPEDGMRWVELGEPELEPEVLTALPEGYRFSANSPLVKGDPPPSYSVFGPKGSTPAVGKTQEEALAAYAKVAAKERARGELSAGLNAEGEAMGHCVGGYCDQVAERGTKIYSLRDKAGNPHVTVEVRPGRKNIENFLASMDESEYGALVKRFESETGNSHADAMRAHPAKKVWFDWLQKYAPEEPASIQQIKGKQNAAPVGKYLPYVQDFVRGGQWGRVGDLGNTGLTKIGPKYFTEDELRKAYIAAGKNSAPFEPFSMDYFDAIAARGGADKVIGGVNESDRAFLRALGFEGYAEGGEVKSPVESSFEDPISSFSQQVDDFFAQQA